MQQPKMFLLQLTQLFYALFKESYDISLLLCKCSLYHPFSLAFFHKSLILIAVIGKRVLLMDFCSVHSSSSNFVAVYSSILNIL